MDRRPIVPRLSPYEAARSRYSGADASAEAMPRGPQSRDDLINFMCRHAKQVEDSIKQLAGYIFISLYPTNVQWDIVRCTVETSSPGLFQMQPHRVASLEHLETAGEISGRISEEDGYALCIRIQVPHDIQLRDETVTRMKNILAYDERQEFIFIPGIPFRGHPIYSLFNIEFTKDFIEKDLTLPRGNIWNLSSAVFLPIPETIRDRDSTLYSLHYTVNDSSINLWQSHMDQWRHEMYRRRREERIRHNVRYIRSEDSEDYGRYEESSVRVSVRSRGSSRTGWEVGGHGRM
ncbi:hypothetical protein F4821DRAFT_279501 [Hypoxylon rubiginosum]|uniref:Uncharacterized protein n=1 Tax=Hypoxylon rubiginosum TaxID=110542 RepID=A0ACC0DH69_9PEZI|nr:hypothetical protein F4821DRAFT_279501 [Hypoxylon rubiginosum]